MRIGLVADTFSVEKGTGVATYSRELLSGLVERGVDVEAICRQAPRLPLGQALNHGVRMPYLVRSRASDFDLLLATSPITALAFPILTQPKVVTYHDLFSLLYRKSDSGFHARLLAPLFLRIGKLADRVIAISTQTKQEMVDHLGIPEGKITVINYGVSEVFRPLKTVRENHHVVGYVGTLDRRKSVDYLLRAFHLLRTRHGEGEAKLVVCGSKQVKSSEYPGLLQLATSLGVAENVEFRGFVARQRLVKTYNSFDVFVLPSEWEGFGLPILEAQRCGVPVIVREDAHIPEEVSQCCSKASSEEDMAGKMYELFTDEGLRQVTVEEGLHHSRQFTWNRTAQETLKVCDAVVSSRKRA